MRLLYQSPTLRVTTKLQSDGLFLVRTEVNDQAVVDANAEVRASDLGVPGRTDAPIHPEGAKIIYWFQADPVLWKRHRRDYPDIHKALMSSDQIARERAAAFIAKDHPEWVCCAPKATSLSQESPVISYP